MFQEQGTEPQPRTQREAGVLAFAGVQESLRQADLTRACQTLQCLDAAATPLEIVACLRDADEILAGAIASLR